MNISLYRKSCVFNFDVVRGQDSRPGGVMISCLPAKDGRYDPSKKVAFFCGINDIMMIAEIFKAREQKSVKIVHKPGGDKNSPITKSLDFAAVKPNEFSVSLSYSDIQDKQSNQFLNTKFNDGTLWALEEVFKLGLKEAASYYKGKRHVEDMPVPVTDDDVPF